MKKTTNPVTVLRSINSIMFTNLTGHSCIVPYESIAMTYQCVVKDEEKKDAEDHAAIVFVLKTKNQHGHNAMEYVYGTVDDANKALTKLRAKWWQFWRLL